LHDEPYLRKQVILDTEPGRAVDRLQVERFTCRSDMRRGGRGEPVFLDDIWFAGLEYPASYIRFGKNFEYRDYKLRNPSKIDLRGRDAELGDTPDGLVTMAHFPGYARTDGSAGASIKSKTSVFGTGKRGDTIELAFLDYLQTIRRGAPRNYLHHNNWYDLSGKNLSVENYIGRTYAALRDNLAPFGVALDGMVPDNGWQDRNSIWEPGSAFDMPATQKALARDGKTGLGLWIALNGYNTNVDWGVKNGYLEAKRNEWFTRFKRYYSLTQPKYNAALRKALRNLITTGGVNYFKHDFNEMCDIGAGRGHLPTDRHGHEASVDAMIDLLAYERQLNPDIFQNLTNWIWFSPWWLVHCDCLWMMGSDAGSNWSWPQLAHRDIATTFRDAHFARLWAPADTRPLIPISTLMTHGIICGDKKRRGDPNETLHDWSNYVMMYYGRGVMLKELYITPSLLSEDRWRVLGMATKWALENAEKLVNSVCIAGNPEDGRVHGYISWTDTSGVLTLRNPDRKMQTVTVPWGQAAWFRGKPGRPWQARTIYPFVEPMGGEFTSAKPFQITIPGDSVMVFEFRPGEPKQYRPLRPSALPSYLTTTRKDSFEVKIPVPDEDMLRCDFVGQFFGNVVFEFTLNGRPIRPDRRTSGKRKVKREISGGKAIESTPPEELPDFTEWTICSIDLRPYAGQTITIRGAVPKRTAGTSRADQEMRYDAWLIADRPVPGSPGPKSEYLPLAISQNHRRQTKQLIRRMTIAVRKAKESQPALITDRRP